jgi:DNA-binding LytR/AlgR family response regulator
MREETNKQQNKQINTNWGGVQLKVNIAICDDQPDVLEEIKFKIKSIDKEITVDTYSDINKFFEAIKTVTYDAVFMDIEWDDESNGIDFASVFKNTTVDVIFVTGYPQKYVEKIFNGHINPIGFLRKPVDDEQLAFLISKIKRRALDDAKCITYSKNGKKYMLLVDEINYFEGNLHKMVICMTNGSRIEVSQSLSKAKKNIPKKFIEIHKSYIVNPNHVDVFTMHKVKMKNGSEIPVSRAKSSSARTAFMEYTALNI